MAYELSERLVVGVASSALFDLAASDAYFRENGEEKYRAYQDEHIDDVLQPGVAFAFIQRLLGLNDLRPGEPLVEVIVLSRNDPNTGLRVMRSVAAHKLAMTRAIFTQGEAPFRYMAELEMSLFLSGNADDVVAAVNAGFAAGHVQGSSIEYDDDKSLRVAFDFDGVLANDESERIYRDEGLEAYRLYESTNRDVPLEPGLFKQLLADLNRIQNVEHGLMIADPSYSPRLRIALVTARNAPTHERAVRSLQEWGVRVNDAFFLGGIEKARVLKVLRPHIFFDDQKGHLESARAHIAAVHVPYGVANPLAAPTGVS